MMADTPENVGAEAKEEPTVEQVEAEAPEDTSVRGSLEEAFDEDSEPSEESENTDDQSSESEGSPVESAESPDEAAAPTDGSEPANVVASEEESEQPLDAPAHWALADQETFRSLDPKGQAFLLERHKSMEADFTKKTQEIAPIRNAVQKWDGYLKQIQASPEMAFEAMIAAEYRLRTGTEAQKREAIEKIAHDYGIPLTAQAEIDEDPLMTDFRHMVQPIQESVSQLQNTVQTMGQTTQEAQIAQHAEQIRQFREAKTEAGAPAHPYYDEVESDIVMLAQAQSARGIAPDLNKLYDDACRINPNVREKAEAAQQHAAKLQQDTERKEKVKQAKKAGKPVSGASASPQEQPMSVEESVRSLMKAS